MTKILIKKTLPALCGLMLITVSNLTSASTLPYGVFEGNDESSLISTITGSDVTELAKVEGWDLSDAGASLSSNGLTITGITPFDHSGENEYIAGSWSYSGTDAIEWLVIKYGTNYGIYEITDGDTSGFWDIVALENYLTDDASGVKIKKDGAVHFSAISHATTYGAVSTVPVPAATWLFISGLMGLVGVSRRKSI